MSRRPPSAPPQLPGLQYVRLLGSGGFADVFLYEQQRPKRQVAVKVLLKESVEPSSAQNFADEADLMARLEHPSIVSIFGADVSSDGRPYLLMEYCSKPNLQVQHRRERLSAAETLRIGIQIAGAVETAHRAGVLHRDIKPANILVTAYGKPKLTDFGIAGTSSTAMAGLSVPWSPPEALKSPSLSGPTSDVYSLAATLYTLMTNRSPFEIPGASNGEVDVMQRIQTLPLPPTGRPDVPPEFEAVLARAMAKDPGERYPTMLEFAHALQRVQIRLGMQETPVDVEEDELLIVDDDPEEERTRFKGVTSIDAQVPVVPAAPVGHTAFTVPQVAPDSTRRVAPAAQAPATVADTVRASQAPVSQPARLSIPEAPAIADTVLRPAAPAEPAETVPPPATGSRSRLIAIIAAAAVVLVAAGVGVAFALALAPSGVPSAAPSASAAPVDLGNGSAPAQVAALAGAVAADGSVVFTWTNPEPEAGDVYLWRPVVPGRTSDFAETTAPTATLPAGTSPACIEVVLRRADGTSALEGAQGCAP